MLSVESNMTPRLRTCDDGLNVDPPTVIRMSFITGNLCLVPNTTTSVFWSLSLSKFDCDHFTPRDTCADNLVRLIVHLHHGANEI